VAARKALCGRCCALWDGGHAMSYICECICLVGSPMASVMSMFERHQAWYQHDADASGCWLSLAPPPQLPPHPPTPPQPCWLVWCVCGVSCVLLAVTWWCGLAPPGMWCQTWWQPQAQHASSWRGRRRAGEGVGVREPQAGGGVLTEMRQCVRLRAHRVVQHRTQGSEQGCWMAKIVVHLSYCCCLTGPCCPALLCSFTPKAPSADRLLSTLFNRPPLLRWLEASHRLAQCLEASGSPARITTWQAPLWPKAGFTTNFKKWQKQRGKPLKPLTPPAGLQPLPDGEGRGGDCIAEGLLSVLAVCLCFTPLLSDQCTAHV
jgi:hypothetical protein